MAANIHDYSRYAVTCLYCHVLEFEFTEPEKWPLNSPYLNPVPVLNFV